VYAPTTGCESSLRASLFFSMPMPFSASTSQMRPATERPAAVMVTV